MVDRKRPPIAFWITMWILPLSMGLMGFYRVTQSPRFEMYCKVDIVQFLTSGMCFGGAMLGVIVTLVRVRR